jgi:FkbM family methyltransferase
MSFRQNLHKVLLGISKHSGIYQWHKREFEYEREKCKSIRSDPFGSGEIRHPKPDTILDIGGSHGQFAKEAIRAFPGINIYSFEPIPECFEELLELKNQVPTLQPINLALSESSGTQDFWLSGFRDSSSLHEMLPTHVQAWPHTQIETKITVELARLDDVAGKLILKEPVFAKIDVQGHELSVIRGGRNTFKACQRIMLECNFAALYKEQPSFDELYEEMKSMGFRLDGFLSPLRHPQTAELLSSDVVFYKIA